MLLLKSTFSLFDAHNYIILLLSVILSHDQKLSIFSTSINEIYYITYKFLVHLEWIQPSELC